MNRASKRLFSLTTARQERFGKSLKLFSEDESEATENILGFDVTKVGQDEFKVADPESGEVSLVKINEEKNEVELCDCPTELLESKEEFSEEEEADEAAETETRSEDTFCDKGDVCTIDGTECTITDNSIGEDGMIEVSCEGETKRVDPNSCTYKAKAELSEDAKEIEVEAEVVLDSDKVAKAIGKLLQGDSKEAKAFCDELTKEGISEDEIKVATESFCNKKMSFSEIQTVPKPEVGKHVTFELYANQLTGKVLEIIGDKARISVTASSIELDEVLLPISKLSVKMNYSEDVEAEQLSGMAEPNKGAVETAEPVDAGKEMLSDADQLSDMAEPNKGAVEVAEPVEAGKEMLSEDLGTAEDLAPTAKAEFEDADKKEEVIMSAEDEPKVTDVVEAKEDISPAKPAIDPSLTEEELEADKKVFSFDNAPKSESGKFSRLNRMIGAKK